MKQSTKTRRRAPRAVVGRVARARVAVRLEQFAAVVAARAEGISLDGALAREGISEAQWARAEAEHVRTLASSTEAFARFVVLLERAEDALSHPLAPFDQCYGEWCR